MLLFVFLIRKKTKLDPLAYEFHPLSFLRFQPGFRINNGWQDCSCPVSLRKGLMLRMADQEDGRGWSPAFFHLFGFVLFHLVKRQRDTKKDNPHAQNGWDYART